MTKLNQPAENPTCGIIMPISLIDGCTAEHWVEVHTIIREAIGTIASPKFQSKLVSDADDSGVIHKRIVQNIYNSDIIVCDVSGKNPNVMFELGMRLAFDKPTVIIVDDKTGFSFDTGVIEHLIYPRDLHYQKIVAFIAKLAEKVNATYRQALNEPDHSTFLKNFGKFQVATITQETVPMDKMLVGMVTELQTEMVAIRSSIQAIEQQSSVQNSTQEDWASASLGAISQGAARAMIQGNHSTSRGVVRVPSVGVVERWVAGKPKG